MHLELIQDRLNEYACTTSLEEENAIKEIVQEICLAALARAGFFKKAVFQGGTCLRVLYHLPRFSEDLDFMLKNTDSHFAMQGYLTQVIEELNSYGFHFEFHNRTEFDDTVQKAFLKDSSWGSLLIFQHYTPHSRQPKNISIKIEIDTRPPAGSINEDRVLDYPFPFTVVAQNLSSLFAGKSHALLCRNYVKGRDWYDFLWYTRKNIQPNLQFLKNALLQVGPWKDKKMNLSLDWYYRAMAERIGSIDWKSTKQDVQRFLRQNELATLKLWSKDFFLAQLDKLKSSWQS